MPVTASVYIHDQVDYRIVFARCAVLTGVSARTRTGDDGSMAFTARDQGQLTRTWVEYGSGGPPLRTAAVPHAPACWIEAVFDAEDGYRGGPGALSQRLVTALGRRLDDQEARWSWRAGDDGILHDGPEGLAELAGLDGQPAGRPGGGDLPCVP